eukprot:sb/3476810/
MIAVDQRLENLNFPRFVLTICFIFQPQVVVNGSTKVLSFDDRGAVKNAKYDIVNFVVDDKNGFFNDVSYMVKCVVLELIFVWVACLRGGRGVGEAVSSCAAGGDPGTGYCAKPR